MSKLLSTRLAFILCFAAGLLLSFPGALQWPGIVTASVIPINDGHHFVLRKDTSVPLGKHRQARRNHTQSQRGGSATFRVRAMTDRTFLGKKHLAFGGIKAG